MLPVSPLTPSLNIRSLANKAVLNWPALYTNWVLEASSDLSQKDNWTAVTNKPAVVGVSLVVTNEMPHQTEYYRLHQPN
jgi:predicted RNA-binding protein with PUA domain